jgi:hypothetical protein
MRAAKRESRSVRSKAASNVDVAGRSVIHLQ